MENVEFGSIEVSGASAVTQHADGEKGTSWEVGEYVGIGGGWWEIGQHKVAGVSGGYDGAIRQGDVDRGGGNLFVGVGGVNGDIIAGTTSIGD